VSPAAISKIENQKSEMFSVVSEALGGKSMRFFSVMVWVGLLAALAAPALAEEQWPGPTPPEIREAKMQAKHVKMPNEQEIQQIEAAVPAKAPATPAKPRKVLVWGRLWTHDPNAFAEEAVKAMARKTRAFEVVATDDPQLLHFTSLRDFDALCLNNLHQPEPFLPEDLGQLPREKQDAARNLDKAVKQSILQFVVSGKGIAGIHASNCALQNWKEYGEMMGGYFGGYILQDLAIKPEDPAHPVNACFEGQTCKIHDEMYFFTEPYSRKNLRILATLDLSQMKFPDKINLPRPGFDQGRPDKDHAISWVRQYGKGRVFYCTLGHCPESYSNPFYLKHLLAGIQFVIGDLPGDTTPSAK
jgi:type 1 glutamine amidotransferase